MSPSPTHGPHRAKGSLPRFALALALVLTPVLVGCGELPEEQPEPQYPQGPRAETIGRPGTPARESGWRPSTSAGVPYGQAVRGRSGSTQAAPCSRDPGSGDAYSDTDPSALTDFHSALDPYGSWVDDPEYGTIWQPSPDVVGEGFAPYETAGHWSYGDDYVWVSEYSWGWAPFHYGRWVYATNGWGWIPGRQYAGAWTTWRTGYGPYYGLRRLVTASADLLLARRVRGRDRDGAVRFVRVLPHRAICSHPSLSGRHGRRAAGRVDRRAHRVRTLDSVRRERGTAWRTAAVARWRIHKSPGRRRARCTSRPTRSRGPRRITQGSRGLRSSRAPRPPSALGGHAAGRLERSALAASRVRHLAHSRRRWGPRRMAADTTRLARGEARTRRSVELRGEPRLRRVPRAPTIGRRSRRSAAALTGGTARRRRRRQYHPPCVRRRVPSERERRLGWRALCGRARRRGRRRPRRRRAPLAGAPPVREL